MSHVMTWFEIEPIFIIDATNEQCCNRTFEIAQIV